MSDRSRHPPPGDTLPRFLPNYRGIVLTSSTTSVRVVPPYTCFPFALVRPCPTASAILDKADTGVNSLVSSVRP